MPRVTLEEYKARVKQKEGGSTSNYYPYYKMDFGKSAVVRFLPDKNENNPFGFYQEKVYHILDIGGEEHKVPCLEAYGDRCPICELSRKFYKQGNKDEGKKYWKKKSRVAQVLVMEDPVPADSETGENDKGKVKLLALGFQLYQIINNSIEEGELDVMPFEYEGGTDFIIKKSTQGEFANYSLGSKFVKRSSDLDDETITFVEEHMIDLSTLISKKPDIADVERMLKMALSGEVPDEEELDDDTTFETETKAKRVQTKAVEEEEAPVRKKANVSKEDSDILEEEDAILANIRARRKAT